MAWGISPTKKLLTGTFVPFLHAPECLTALGASACGNKELNNKRAGLAWLPCLRNNSPGRSVSDRLAGAAGT